MPSTYTNTHTYTKSRTEVVRDQFELFLRYTGMQLADREGLLASIARGCYWCLPRAGWLPLHGSGA